LDESCHIENEWRALVAPEWFDPWLATLLQQDKVCIVRATRSRQLTDGVLALGFPRSKDLWYIRVANTVQNCFGGAIILTEDLDFFDPKEKRFDSSRRKKVLMEGRGCVRKRLKKNNIDVRSVCSFLEE
jgi:hypothetical protein